MKIDLHHFQTDPSHTLNPPMKIVRNCSILLGTQKIYRWWVLRRRDYDGCHVQLMIDGFVNVCENRSSVMSGVQRPGMLPTSPSVQPDPMPAMSPVSPEVGPLGGELGGAMDAFFIWNDMAMWLF